MKSYPTLIKKLKQEIEEKQKELETAIGERLQIEQQIELLLESVEKEKFFVSSKRFDLNTVYFDASSKKISSYTQMLSRKTREVDALRCQLLELFRSCKKYELLLDKLNQEKESALRKKSDFEMQDIFQSARSQAE